MSMENRVCFLAETGDICKSCPPLVQPSPEFMPVESVTQSEL